MTARTHAIAVPLLLVASLMVAGGPATAIYVITPLTMTASANEAQVGDELTFDLAPNPDHEGPSYAGASVRVQYGWDRMEGQHEPSENPNETVSSDDETENTHEVRDLTTVTLDGESRGSFTWTIPEEVDDRNVFVTILSEKDETLASAHVRVGDAEPMMFALRSGSGAEPAMEGAPEGTPPATTEGGAEDATTTTDEARDEGGNDVPGVGLLAAAAAVGLAALALRRR